MDIDNYTEIISHKIRCLFETKNKKSYISDILLNRYFENHKKEIKNSLTIKQIQMKIGNIWQIAIGYYTDFKFLGNGHHTGLDIKNKNRKIIMELKNRYNTDNHSAKKSNYDKLARYKKKHDNYECIYGVINCRTLDGIKKVFYIIM